MMAFACKQGLGCEKDSSAAISWAKRAATAGMSEAQLALGYWFCDDDSDFSNRLTGLEWFKQAAEQGDQHAGVRPLLHQQLGGGRPDLALGVLGGQLVQPGA